MKACDLCFCYFKNHWSRYKTPKKKVTKKVKDWFKGHTRTLFPKEREMKLVAWRFGSSYDLLSYFLARFF